MITGFYAYPSSPKSVGDSINAAIETINRANEVELRPWSTLNVTGRFIIHEILQAIDSADLFCADITNANPNVLFELGYAIAKNKRTWVTVDRSYPDSNAKLESLRLLSTIGYAPYENSNQIVQSFYAERPQDDLLGTIFAKSVQPNLPAAAQSFQVLYVKSPHENEAAIRIARRIDASSLSFIQDNPLESPIPPLVWYATQVYLSAGVICHLTNPQREKAAVYNARSALVAGMTYAMGKPLLLLAEGDYLNPIDYRDIVTCYPNSRSALTTTDTWLAAFERDQKVLDQRRSEYFQTVALATQLKSLQIGEFIAENEVTKLTEEYFVETAAYGEALSGRHTIFAGRKGAGKTATFVKMAADLSSDKRNIVVSIRPVAYEVQGVVALLAGLHSRDVKGFAIESLWKFLLMSELANVLAESLESREPVTLSNEENELITFMNRDGTSLRSSFVDRLETKLREYAGAKDARAAISEDIHRGTLHALKQRLMPLLNRKRRVYFLIDNLDLAWDQHDDYATVSQLILGLLGAAQSTVSDLSGGPSAPRLQVGLSLFLRSDILAQVRTHAPEPDKVDAFKIAWSDPEVLGRVIDERLVKSQDEAVSPVEMWERFFSVEVRGIPTRQYMLNAVLPRPRDLVYFARQAVAIAVNRQHTVVEEADILVAQEQYSEFARDMLLVEGEALVPALDNVLLAFAATPPTVSKGALNALLKDAELRESQYDAAVDGLVRLGFLGLEVEDNVFKFTDDFTVDARSKKFAARLIESTGREQQYAINPAFWPYLGTRVDYKRLNENTLFMRRSG